MASCYELYEEEVSLLLEALEVWRMQATLTDDEIRNYLELKQLLETRERR